MSEKTEIKVLSETVMVFGTFDLLHPGHLSYFRQARRHGKRLVCVVARDETVREVKGSIPSKSEDERFTTVAACGLVDHTVLGSETDVFHVLTLFDPDVICLGYDQETFIEKLPIELKKRNITCVVKRMRAYQPATHKSSVMKKVQTKG